MLKKPLSCTVILCIALALLLVPIPVRSSMGKAKDFTGDGLITFKDIGLVSRNVEPSDLRMAFDDAGNPYDLDGDGHVTMADAEIEAGAFGQEIEDAQNKEGAHTFWKGPLFTSIAFLTFNLSDWTFKAECLGETVVLRPYGVVSGNRQVLKSLELAGVSAVGNVENRTSHYKFGLNVSAPTAVKMGLSAFGWSIETKSAVTVDGYAFRVERFGIDFTDLVDAGFTVKVNNTDVAVSGLDGKALEFDPTAFSTVNITGIHTCPLDERTFVIAYGDDTNDDVSFQVWDTNGTQVLAETDVDTTAGATDYAPVGVSAFNDTWFVIGWYDNGDLEATFAICNKIGTVQNITDVETAYAYTYSMSVSCFNSTHFVIAWGWTDGDVSSTANFAVYNSNGAVVTSETVVTTAAVSVLSVSAMNSTAFAFAWYDLTNSDATFAVYWINGTAIQTATDIDTAVGTSCSVSVTCLNETYFVVSYFDAVDYDVSYAMYYANGTNKIAASDLDQTVGASSRSTQVTRLNSTHYVISYYDYVDFDLQYAILDSSNNTVVAITDIESWPTSANAPFKYQSPCGHDAATDIGLYEPTDDGGSCWVIAYANTTTQADWAAYWPNGTAWDGTIPSAGDSTKPTYSSSSTNTTIVGYNCNFSVLIQDETALANFTWGTNNTGAWTNETLVEISGTSFTVNYTKALNTTHGILVQWQCWFADTSNNVNDTGLQNLTTTGYVFEAGWNNFTAESMEDGKTLGELNASYVADSLDWTMTVLELDSNSTRYPFWYEHSYNSTVIITEGDTIYIWCTEQDTWTQSYS